VGIYKNGKNKNFYFSLCHNGKRFQGSTGLSNHDEATIFFLELKNKITNKKLIYINKTYDELVNYYYASYHKNDQRILDWSLKFLKGRTLASISGHELRELQNYKALRVKGSTVNRQFNTIRAIFNKAVIELGWLEYPPKFKKHKEDQPDKQILTKEEEIRLLRELPDHLQRLVSFALETGLRKSTIVRLTYDMYDHKTHMLRIPAKLMKAKKNHDMPVSLKAHNLIMFNKRGLVLNQGLGAFRGRHIFTYQGKNIINPASSAWNKARTRAKVTIRFHDLRHTWATRQIEKGMPVAHVQYLGGWSSPKMMQQYLSISPENLSNLEQYGY
tara:strand:- start:112 stop:1098 length:987 start_codon:yes stop_codon:yes gene_type:complete